MSAHISKVNSMLEHLRVGPLKRIMPTENDDSGQQKQQPKENQTPSTTNDYDSSGCSSSTMMAKGNGAIVSGGSDDVDNSRVSVVINDTRKKSLREFPNGGIVGTIDGEKRFDPRKRYSISNGDLRSNGKTRELSPAATMKQQQRKLSADMRLRGSNSQLTDDYLLRRPVRLRSMCTNFEVYDSLHTKAMDVSTILTLTLTHSIQIQF